MGIRRARRSRRQGKLPLRWQAWLLVLGFGPLIHWLFSVALYVLKVKARPA